MYIEIGTRQDAVVVKYGLIDGIKAINDSIRFWESSERKTMPEDTARIIGQLQRDKQTLQRVIDQIEKDFARQDHIV